MPLKVHVLYRAALLVCSWCVYGFDAESQASEKSGILWGPLYNEENGHSYAVLPQTTWTEAHQAAVQLGGHLAAINDRAECFWIYRNLCFAGGVARPLWIGFTDQDHEGLFRWTSGEPVTFSNWSPGEPNNDAGMGTPEHYAFIFPSTSVYDSRWKDASDAALSDWDDVGKWFGSLDFAIGAFGLVEFNGRIAGASPPVDPTILTILKGSSTVEISWKAKPNWRYQLQSSPVAGPVRWSEVDGPVHEAVGESKVTRPTEDLEALFFRVVAKPAISP